MKRNHAWLVRALGLVAVVFLTGFGNVSVYQGSVRAIGADSITILNNNGTQQKFIVNNLTRTFVSGKILPVTRIKPNSHVQIAVDGNDVCLQIVVEEVPK